MTLAEKPRRLNRVRRVIEDTVGISGYQNGRNQAGKIYPLGKSDHIMFGVSESLLQVLTPLTYRATTNHAYEKEAYFPGLIAILLDTGTGIAAVAIAMLAGPETGIGAKVIYNASASAIPDIASSVSTRIKSARAGTR